MANEAEVRKLEFLRLIAQIQKRANKKKRAARHQQRHS